MGNPNDVTLVSALTAQAEEMLESARSYVIDSQLAADAAGQDLAAIRQRKDAVEAAYTAERKPFHDRLVSIQEAYSKPREFLKQAEQILSGALKKFLIDAEAKAEAARRAAQEAAERERRNIEALAAKARAEAEEAGDADALAGAEAMAASAQFVTPAVVAGPAVQGVGAARNWDYEVTDESLIPDKYWTLDVKRLAKDVKALHESEINSIPGIRVFNNPTLRRKRKGGEA